MNVHNQGVGVAGVYSYEIADGKVRKVIQAKRLRSLTNFSVTLKAILFLRASAFNILRPISNSPSVSNNKGPVRSSEWARTAIAGLPSLGN